MHQPHPIDIAAKASGEPVFREVGVGPWAETHPGEPRYIVETKATVRQAAKKFGISKSTVHKDCAERLKVINPALAIEVRKVLDVNKQERHIRGGIATREKYLHAHMR